MRRPTGLRREVLFSFEKGTNMQAIETAAMSDSRIQSESVLFGRLVPIENTLNDPNIRLAEVVWESEQDDGQFDRLVEAGLAIPDEEVARFSCPDLEDPSMLWGSPEFFRWYYADGKKRSQPLDYDELVDLICRRDHCTTDEAEREVTFHSRARKGDKELWKRIEQLGYADFANYFAQGEYGVF